MCYLFADVSTGHRGCRATSFYRQYCLCRYASRDKEGRRDRADDRGARHRSSRYEREYRDRSTSPR